MNELLDPHVALLGVVLARLEVLHLESVTRNGLAETGQAEQRKNKLGRLEISLNGLSAGDNPVERRLERIAAKFEFRCVLSAD